MLPVTRLRRRPSFATSSFASAKTEIGVEEPLVVVKRERSSIACKMQSHQHALVVVNSSKSMGMAAQELNTHHAQLSGEGEEFRFRGNHNAQAPSLCYRSVSCFFGVFLR